MSKFTNQFVLNKSVTKLRAQNKRSIGSYRSESGGFTEGCAYRGEDGLRCAIGHMIPNKYYRKWMEGFVPTKEKGGNFERLYEVLIEIGYTDEQIKFMKELQEIHDNETLWEQRETQWKAIAEKYELTMPKFANSLHSSRRRRQVPERKRKSKNLMDEVIKKILLIVDEFTIHGCPLTEDSSEVKEIRYLIASYAMSAIMDSRVAQEAEMLCKSINEWEAKRLYEKMQKEIAEGHTWGLTSFASPKGECEQREHGA